MEARNRDDIQETIVKVGLKDDELCMTCVFGLSREAGQYIHDFKELTPEFSGAGKSEIHRASR